MRFTIVQNKNGHTPPQSSCDFLPPGGTIGRSVDNNLVLPDDERAISRLQAIVHISADGECRITNRGNVTRVVLNDIPLERGRQVELQNGDVLGIDDYRIQVSAPHQQAAPVQQQRAVDDTPPPVAAAATPVPNEIWDSLVEEFTPAAAQPEPVPQAPLRNDNPLLAQPRPELNPADPLAQLAGDVDLHHLQHKQTDPNDLFNGNTPFERENILNDTTPSTLLAGKSPASVPLQPAPGAVKKTPQQELDPLALFGGGSSSSPAAPETLTTDDPLGLLMGGAAPLAQADVPPARPQPQPQPQPEPAPAPKPQPPTPPAAEAAPVAPEPTPTPAPVPQQPRPRPGNRLGIDPVAYQAPQPQPAGAHPGDALHGPMLEALLQGIGLNDLQPQPQIDEQQMQLVGRLLSLFSQGTVALLSSRSILKRGVKAEMTMILDEANNPFKLLPSGKTVLMQMFGSRMPGFMPPEQAVRDALIDLQAHQLGMIAGIRAIIAAMLQSFNPERLEEEARKEGAAPRLSLPSNRKAALWDYFVKNYQQTAGEIEDDFHTLFGEAFLHAYDVEVNQYKDSQTKPDAQ
ncbi:type VI secretion system-associated FHA domain protein TagH [Gibbsiella dentisursi]|uniref:Type VI secretion system-associated FHA domain protein TagH n=1 Tax=Gibbsiella dentisursi TaxID=796890 RepID=A0ABP7L543_9GAMM